MNAHAPTNSGGGAAPEHGVAPPGHRLPGGARLGPVALQVADLGRSQEFYQRVLGLEERERSTGRLRLGANGGTETLVELVERPGALPATPRGRLGLFHYALLLPDRADLARFARHVAGLDHRVGMSDHRVSQALYLSDPDGHGIEVYADRPRDEWRWEAGQLVMTTDPLDLGSLLAQAGPESFAGLPGGTTMGHVHLHVGDLDRAAGFYHGGLGFDKVVWNYPGALFLSAGGYHHHVGINVWAAGAPPAGITDARLLTWTLVLPQTADVEATVTSLENGGHAVRRAGEYAWAEDPWGTPVLVVAQGARLTELAYRFGEQPHAAVDRVE